MSKRAGVGLQGCAYVVMSEAESSSAGETDDSYILTEADRDETVGCLPICLHHNPLTTFTDCIHNREIP